MTKETGGSAFPIHQETHINDPQQIIQYADAGMTLRDYFAGMALQGICAAMPITSRK